MWFKSAELSERTEISYIALTKYAPVVWHINGIRNLCFWDTPCNGDITFLHIVGNQTYSKNIVIILMYLKNKSKAEGSLRNVNGSWKFSYRWSLGLFWNDFKMFVLMDSLHEARWFFSFLNPPSHSTPHSRLTAFLVFWWAFGVHHGNIFGVWYSIATVHSFFHWEDVVRKECNSHSV